MFLEVATAVVEVRFRLHLPRLCIQTAPRRTRTESLRRRRIASGVYVRTIEYQTNGNGMVVDAINAVVFAISLKTFFRVKICAIRRGVGAANAPTTARVSKEAGKPLLGQFAYVKKKFKAPSTAK